MTAPLPNSEKKRLEVLWDYGVLDTPPEAVFDDLTAVAAQVCEAPIALISLVDECRQWFKSKVGLSVSETARDISFCTHAIQQKDVFVVPDAAKDPRFAHSPLVTAEPGIRFYAGAPLITPEGQALGMLCVLDRVPHDLKPGQAQALRTLAQIVMAQLEPRRRTIPPGVVPAPCADLAGAPGGVAASDRSGEGHTRLATFFGELAEHIRLGVHIWQWQPPEDLASFRLLAANTAAARLTGVASESIVGKTMAEAFPRLRETEIPSALAEAIRSRKARDLELFHYSDGRVTDCDFSVRVFPLPGRRAGMAFENITDRRLAEQAQVESQARKSAILDSALDAIVTIDHEGRMFEWNPAAEQMFGHRRSAVLGKELAALLFPESERPRIREGLARYLAHGISSLIGRRIELTARRADGSELPVELSVVHVPKTKPPIFTGFIRDITERKLSEITLREREATLLEAQRIGRLGSWELKLTGGILEWSDETYRIFGRSRDGFVPTRESFYESVHPADRERVRRAAEEALAGGPPYRVEHRIVRPDSSQGVVHERAELVCDADGRPLRWLGTVQDITERQQMEEALQRSEEHFRSLIDNSSDVIAILTGQGTLIYVSHTVQRILQYQPPDLLNRSVFDLIHPEDTARVRDALGRALRGPDVPNPVEFRFRRADATWRFLEAIGQGRKGNDGRWNVVVNARDVTERRQLEDQLRHAQKMESVGQLAGGVAHDFNNILTVIQGHASLLLAGKALGRRETLSVQQINLAAERAANLTRQLLTFSRKQVLQPRLLDLNEVVNGMGKMLQRLLGEDISLHVHYSPNLPGVLADAGMLEQVLLNLAVNARDAMPKGGQLIINTNVARIADGDLGQNPDAYPGEFVCLSVSDTGTGIAPEHVSHIFEPFFTTKDVGKGTGLGLATVYGIIKQHRGWVTVASEVGKGTVFQVFLPANAGRPADAAAPAADTPVRGGRETILIVEDETAVCELVRDVLEKLGYHVLTAPTGPAALKLWPQHRGHIDLLLTDMVMPHGMTGRELGKQLQLEKPSLKVIYTSGYSAEALGAEFQLDSSLVFLQKPYQTRKLAELIRAELDAD
jgi:PAS domain S-box-containing protein